MRLALLAEMARNQVAGYIIYNPKDMSILILQRPDGRWDIPKGRVEKGEKPSKGAARECYEETGLKPKVVKGPCHPKSYYHIWLAETKKTKVKLKEDEHIKYKWVPIDKALSKLDGPLAQAVDMLMD